MRWFVAVALLLVLTRSGPRRPGRQDRRDVRGRPQRRGDLPDPDHGAAGHGGHAALDLADLRQPGAERPARRRLRARRAVVDRALPVGSRARRRDPRRPARPRRSALPRRGAARRGGRHVRNAGLRVPHRARELRARARARQRRPGRSRRRPARVPGLRPGTAASASTARATTRASRRRDRAACGCGRSRASRIAPATPCATATTRTTRTASSSSRGSTTPRTPRPGLAPYASVRLVWETRPDPESGYFAGVLASTTRRLASLETWFGEERVREYRLSYEANPQTGRSRARVAEAVRARRRVSAGRRCSTWEQGAAGWLEIGRWDLPRQLWADSKQEGAAGRRRRRRPAGLRARRQRLAEARDLAQHGRRLRARRRLAHTGRPLLAEPGHAPRAVRRRERRRSARLRALVPRRRRRRARGDAPQHGHGLGRRFELALRDARLHVGLHGRSQPPARPAGRPERRRSARLGHRVRRRRHARARDPLEHRLADSVRATRAGTSP